MQIVWFKRDLRVFDHRPLAEAALCGPVLPLYIVEPELWQQPDQSARQWAFTSECLYDLRIALGELGQPLIVQAGDAIDVLARLHKTHKCKALWSHEETGNRWTFARDQRVEQWCRSSAISWHQIAQHGVIRRLGNRDGWARRWDRQMAGPLTPAPHLTPLSSGDEWTLPTAHELGLQDDGCEGRQSGGRDQGLALLDSFLNERGEPYQRAMSSPLAGAEACSRLSPYLALGALSMREVAQATWQRQREARELKQTNWRKSLRSFSGRLHWHCHFMQKLEDEPDLEFKNLHQAYDDLRPKPGDRTLLDAWCAGETGLPFVDACMRSLKATGWINFRMRAMLMAVASYHLWLDWRAPGEHLARMFTDYEPGIHWPQVQMQSGTTGMNTVRIYNPVKQGKDQDADGAFTRRWLPELAAVPDEFLHEPWLWPDHSTILGKTYPSPVVDHLQAAKDARAQVWGVRRGQPFRDKARQLQAKHGSRRSGIANRGRQTKAKAQLSLLDE